MYTNLISHIQQIHSLSLNVTLNKCAMLSSQTLIRGPLILIYLRLSHHLTIILCVMETPGHQMQFTLRESKIGKQSPFKSWSTHCVQQWPGSSTKRTPVIIWAAPVGGRTIENLLMCGDSDNIKSSTSWENSYYAFPCARYQRPGGRNLAACAVSLPDRTIMS